MTITTNPDSRPLPAGWITEYDANRGQWMYIDTTSDSAQPLYIHPSDTTTQHTTKSTSRTSSTGTDSNDINNHNNIQDPPILHKSSSIKHRRKSSAHSIKSDGIDGTTTRNRSGSLTGLIHRAVDKVDDKWHEHKEKKEERKQYDAYYAENVANMRHGVVVGTSYGTPHGPVEYTEEGGYLITDDNAHHENGGEDGSVRLEK